jgi:hypothetical protein
MKRIFLGLVLVSLLSGCATAKPTPTPTHTKTQAQIETEFLKIADDSCNKAQAEDIIERMTNDAPARVIVLARAHAYKNYSAIYVDNKGVAQVVYELELTVCGPSYLISMQKEAHHDNSGDYEHHIKLNPEGTYSWNEHVSGEAAGVLSTTTFTVKDGLITASKADNAMFDRTFQYGPITGDDLQVLKDAVDAELVRIG